MKFHTFINDNLEAIVSEWEAFARTLLPAAESMSDLALRDHGREIVLAIIEDMQTSRSDADRSARFSQAPVAVETVAGAHGAMRHAAGFDIAQVVSEFNALRSSVLALWRDSDAAAVDRLAIDEMARFNRAIDQALGESVNRYSSMVAASRDLFLAVLAHDMRSPLQGIVTASHLLIMPELSEPDRMRAALRIRRASETMVSLTTDLVEFTRSRLGRGIPIRRSRSDIGQVCEAEIDAVRATYPQQKFTLRTSGDLTIQVDAPRVRQVIANLLNNAIQHGDEKTEVWLNASGEEHSAVLSVTNFGSVIPPDALQTIFEPLVQVPATTSDLNRRQASSLGLGLYIVREIVIGHQGTIDVHSAVDTGTVFTIRLPRATLSQDA